MKILTQMFFLSVSLLFFAACSTNPYKAKKIETKIEKKQEVSAGENLGVKDGNLIVQKKVQMNEELRRIQNEVYSLEDRVYGNRKFGSEGLYGALKNCRKDLVSTKYGGNGKLMWTEPMDRITDKEEEWKVGIDEKDKIVGVSEEFLLDRIKRFRGYKQVLVKREDEYNEKLEICDAALEAKKHQAEQKKESEANN